jgi:hypothetical protein
MTAKVVKNSTFDSYRKLTRLVVESHGVLERCLRTALAKGFDPDSLFGIVDAPNGRLGKRSSVVFATRDQVTRLIRDPKDATAREGLTDLLTVPRSTGSFPVLYLVRRDWLTSTLILPSVALTQSPGGVS